MRSAILAPYLPARRRRPSAGLYAACAGLAIALLPAVTFAQEADPSETPGVTPGELLPEPAAVRPVRRPDPLAPSTPGLTEGEDWLEAVKPETAEIPKPRILPEGSFIVAREGRLVDGPAGSLIFVPRPADRTPGEGPMLLLPSRSTARLRSQTEFRRENLTIALSGEVHTYRGRNYLLPTTFALRTPPAAPPENPKPADAPASGATTSPTTTPTPARATASPVDADPDVAALIAELEELQDAPAAIDPSATLDTGANEPETGATTVQLLPEGTPIVRRRARMIRENDGAWSVVFDNDNDQSDKADDRLVLLPCQMLEQMEQQALRIGDRATFIVSGRVTSDHKRNYLLPTLIQIARDNGVKTLR